MSTIYQKLQSARIKLQQIAVKKSGWNDFSKYHYFELSDYLPIIQTIFSEVGLCGIVSYGVEIAELSIFEFDGDGRISITSPMSTAKLKACHEVQNLGAVQTYIRRYLWQSALEIVEHDIVDASSGITDDKPAEKPALDYCTVDKFNSNKKAWKGLVELRKKSAKELISTLETKTRLTDAQLKEIKSWEAIEGDLV
jgi:hypothetical protein